MTLFLSLHSIDSSFLHLNLSDDHSSLGAMELDSDLTRRLVLKRDLVRSSHRRLMHHSFVGIYRLSRVTCEREHCDV